MSSTKLYVIRSVGPSSTLGNELKSMLESESHVNILDEHNDILAITWLVDGSTIGNDNSLLSRVNGCDLFMVSFRYGIWQNNIPLPISKRLKRTVSDRESKYQSIAVTMEILYPYKAIIHSGYDIRKRVGFTELLYTIDTCIVLDWYPMKEHWKGR